MDIEQKLPNKPNFGLILGLACAAVVVCFALALFFLHIDEGHLSFRHHSAHPTSQLVLPQLDGYLESAA